MLFPYQIGDTPLYSFFSGRDDEGITLSVDPKWRFSEITFTGRRGVHLTNPATYALSDLPDFEVSGTILARDSAHAQWIQSAVNSLGGRINIPLIVFRYENPLKQGECSELDWLYADAIILSSELEYNYGGTEASQWGHLSLSLKISGKLLAPFARMPKWVWEYRSYQERVQDPFAESGSSSPNNTFFHPTEYHHLQREGHFVRWLHPDTLLDTSYWGVKYFQDTSGGVGEDFGDFKSVFYYANPQLWSALPQALYAFTELLPYGSIQIDVQQSTGFFANDDFIESSILDLAQLDTDLNSAGYGGLFNSDLIYTGAVTPYPGFIVRNGVILSDIRPRWLYTGEYPGIVKNGATNVNIQAVLTAGKMAYLFDYGLTG